MQLKKLEYHILIEVMGTIDWDDKDTYNHNKCDYNLRRRKMKNT